MTQEKALTEEKLKQKTLEIVKPYVEELLDILSAQDTVEDIEEYTELDEKTGDILAAIERAFEKEGFEAVSVINYANSIRVELSIKLYTEKVLYIIYVAGVKMSDRYDIWVYHIESWNLASEDTPFSKRLDELWNYPIRELWSESILRTIDDIIAIERKGRLREELPLIYSNVKANSWIHEFRYLKTLIEYVAKEFNIPLEK
jgi:hypothetical protein